MRRQEEDIWQVELGGGRLSPRTWEGRKEVCVRQGENLRYATKNQSDTEPDLGPWRKIAQPRTTSSPCSTDVKGPAVHPDHEHQPHSSGHLHRLYALPTRATPYPRRVPPSLSFSHPDTPKWAPTLRQQAVSGMTIPLPLPTRT